MWVPLPPVRGDPEPKGVEREGSLWGDPKGGISALPIQAQPNPQGIAPILDGRTASGVLWIAVPPFGDYAAEDPSCSGSSGYADHSSAQRLQGKYIAADALGTQRAKPESFVISNELSGPRWRTGFALQGLCARELPRGGPP